MQEAREELERQVEVEAQENGRSKQNLLYHYGRKKRWGELLAGNVFQRIESSTIQLSLLKGPRVLMRPTSNLGVFR